MLLFTPRALSGKAGIPLTVLEALATGRPVSTSDRAQFTGLGDAVLRAPVGDVERSGHLLAQLLAEPRRWEAAAERGSVTVRARFGPERFAREYALLHQKLLG